MMKNPENSGASLTTNNRVAISILLGAVLSAGVYMLLRYGGASGETDTHVFARAIHAMFSAAKLVPEEEVYPNGYSYQALVVFLMHISGISLPDFQLIASPLLMAWIILPAWLAYRELTRSAWGATLATAILFVQPEFLYAVMRGTHEKFTRGLMLICLYLLLRSFRERQTLRRLFPFVVTFYLAAFALITLNNLMATSFIAAIAVALILCWMVMRGPSALSRTALKTNQRLIYIVVSLMVLACIFTFYAYPPAQLQIYLLNYIGSRLAALLLQVGTVASINPYTVVNQGWVSLPVYFMVSLANWLMLAVSAFFWLQRTYALIVRRKPFDEQSELFLWAFYTAFALQAGLSIAVDVSGALAANFQHRIFPSFAMLAAPLIARRLVAYQAGGSRLRPFVQNGLTAGFAFLAVLSLLKATNDPLLSNKWLFYLPAEIKAITWSESALAGRAVWTEFDDRLSTSYGILTGEVPAQVDLDQYQVEPGTRDFLATQVTRQRSLRLMQPLPIEGDSLVTYDNGQAQMYHLRPRTPYQR